MSDDSNRIKGAGGQKGGNGDEGEHEGGHGNKDKGKCASEDDPALWTANVEDTAQGENGSREEWECAAGTQATREDIKE